MGVKILSRLTKKKLEDFGTGFSILDDSVPHVILTSSVTCLAKKRVESRMLDFVSVQNVSSRASICGLTKRETQEMCAMSSKNTRGKRRIGMPKLPNFWRRLFQTFGKGDRVVITARSNYKGLRGIVLYRCTRNNCKGTPTHYIIRLDAKDTVTFWEKELKHET